MQDNAQYSKNSFLWTGLSFSQTFQNFMPHIENIIFCQNRCTLMYTYVPGWSQTGEGLMISRQSRHRRPEDP
jgi:hypothetical protein